MRNTFKRLTAVLLLVCTLMSFVVPATFADAGNGDTVVYDFELYNNSAFEGTVDGAYEKYTKPSVKTAVDGAYPDTINWKFEDMTSGLVPKFVADQGIRTDTAVGNYIAIRLMVKDAARYTITYNSVYGYNFGAKTWIVPAPAEGKADVAAAKIAENAMGNVAITTGTLSSELGSCNLEAGEYVLILEATAARIYLGNIVLTKAGQIQETTEGTTAPLAEPINYDFQLVTNSLFSFAEADKYGKKAGDIKAAYKAGTNNWMLEATVSTVSSASEMRFYAANDNEGLRLSNVTQNEWIALRLNVAQAGNYQVAVTGGNVKARPYEATVYAFPAPAGTSADSTMSAAEVEAAMVNANAVGLINVNEDNARSIAGEHTFAQGDNILVIKLNPSTDRVSIADIDLTPKASSEEETDPTENTTVPAREEKIDFELYNYDAFKEDITGASEKYSGRAAKIAEAYTAGTVNWKIDYRTYDPRFVISSGVPQGLRGKDLTEGATLAIRFRVLEDAKYDVRFNSVYGYNFGAKVWLVPASAEDMNADAVAAAKIAENAMGNVQITTQTRSCELGSYTFTAGEYVLILESTTDRLYIGSLLLTEVPEDVEETTAPTEETTVPQETTEPPVTVLQDNVFDMELYYNAALSGAVDGNYTKIGKFESAMNSAYPNGVNWKFEGFSSNDIKNSIRVIGKTYSSDRGIKFGVAGVTDYFFAVRLNVAKAGKFDVVVKNIMTTNYYTADTWLVPATAETMTTGQLKAAMVDANKLGNIAMAKDQMESNLGTYDFAAGEYVLIVAPSADSVYMSSIELATPGEYEKPEEDTRTEYENKPGYFDMRLFNYKGFDVLSAGYIKYSKAEALMKSKYPTSVNWILEAVSANASITSDVQFIGSKGEGLRLNTDDGVNGEWMALRLNNTKAGKFDLILNSDVGSYSGKVWLFPAAAEKMTAAQIAARMTDENLLGSIKFSTDVDSYNLGEYEFAAGEYIIVLKADKTRVTVDSVEIVDHIVEVPKEPVDKIIYDLDLVAMDPQFKDKGFTNWYSKDENDKGILRVYQKIAEMYKAGTLNWKYETMSDTAKRFNCRENHTQVKADTNFMDVKNAWNALRLSAPGAGTYDVRINSDVKSSVVADIYLIPARTGIAMTNEEIEAAMTSKNLLVSGALLSGEGDFYLGEYTFGTEYEYVLVLKFTRGKKLYMNHIKLTKDGMLADSEVKKLPTYNGVVYDFDIGDEFTGFLQPLSEYRYDAPTPKEAGYAAPIDQANAAWNSGRLNWKWIAASDDLIDYMDDGTVRPNDYIRFYSETGMYVYSKKNSWVAFTIKSPGEGDFTLTMNHAVAANDGTVAVYILPADTPTDKIWQTTDPSNRVGKVVLTKEDGTSGKEDGHESFIGYWNFEAGKEYILVLEGYENSKFSSNYSNMNISNIVMQKGIHEYKTAETKKVNPVTVKERVLATSDLGNGNVAIFEMNGMDYYLTQLEGGTILLYNLTTGELEKENYISTARPRHMAVAPDGKVWMTGAGKFLVCYDPQTNTLEKTKYFMPDEYKHNGPSYMTITPKGIIYFALSGRGNIVEYNPATKQYRDLGVFVDPLDDLGGMLYIDGYLYSTHRVNGENDSHNTVVKYNIATGKIEGTLELIEHSSDDFTHISRLGEDIIVIGGKTYDNDHTMAFNKDTMEFVDLGLPGSVSKSVTEEINGKQYMVLTSNGLYEYDVATKEITKVTGFSSMSGSGFRAGAQESFGKSWAMINGDLCLLSNDSQITSCPRVINLTKKEYYRWTDLTKDASGGGSRIISFTETEPGAGELVMGHWNAEAISTYNIYTGEVTMHESAGQTDSIGYYKGILYGGCYSATVLVELHRDTNEIIQRFKLDHDITGQKRLLSMETGGDHVFVGSVPGTNIYGGALTVYNTLNGQWYYERNLVQDQSIVNMAYSNELVFVASSRSGGDNTPDSGDSALIVAYDYINREKLAELDPRDYIPGLLSPVHYIYGLTADPNSEENGRIWAMVSDTLFCFTFDRETKKFDVQVVRSFGKSSYNTSSGVARQQDKIRFVPEKGQMYAMFKDAGMQLITLEDWNAPIGQVKIASCEKIMGYKPEDYIIAEDGNMYFENDADLMMLPLNVTDEDWEIAKKMDDVFQQIHDGEITLASEGAIRTARSDYENMSWRYKALVQKLELLQEAESDILEVKIDAALLNNEIDADDYPALLELYEEYDGLNDRQQRYVKNYEALKEAYELASQLNDERIAAAMQEKVNALKDIMPIETLEKEPQVVAVRTEFDALAGRQRILVDTTVLEEAEAQVAVLRAELVKQVEVLIQAIPAETTLDAEPAITAAREGVDKLTALERKQVSYSKLENAEAKLRNLKNALAKAQEFDALMKEIGIVTLGDAERIANARKVYNSLNETARAFATKYGKLRRAEFILSALQSWGIPVMVVAGAGAAFCVTWFVPSLHSKVFKTKKKEEETEVIDN